MRKVGLDGNRPVENRAPAWRVHPPDFMADAGTAYVRINFLLDQWSSPAESGWLQVYDTIVNGLKGRGIEVYGLIGHETVLESPEDKFRNARESAAANAWIEKYVENSVTIVQHFRDRVKIFESFNEPNDWHGQDKAWIHPYWFAKMLERVYRAVKLERGFTDVILVSGPLLAHDIGGGENETSMATAYLRDTYQAGKEKHGWEDVRSSFRSYPLDGIGYHLYVRESSESTPADIQRTHKKYLDAISRIVQQQDVAADKKIYISEFGWSSASGEEFQARSLKAGFELLRKDSRVALAIYFCTQDFPGKEYGLVKMNKEKKPAYNAFLEQVRLEREAMGVTVEPTPQEKIVQLEREAQGLRQQLAVSRETAARLEGEAQGLRQQLATSQTTATQLQQEVQGLRQQAAASQETLTQLRRQVDTLRQQLVAATTTTTTPTPPVTPTPTLPATPLVITPPPMADVTANLRCHPVKRFDKRTLDQIKYLVIQHSVLPGDFPPEKIADFLVEKRQWPGIGYHFYLTSDGTIYQTNRLETACYFAGANTQDNPLGVCICFAGDFTTGVPTAAQLSSGGKLLAFLMQELNLSTESIRGQKEFVATQSPGQQWDSGQKWKDLLLTEIRAAQS
jgi:regulator of replication initiation timing